MTISRSSSTTPAGSRSWRWCRTSVEPAPQRPRRAAVFFAAHGVRIERVLTDNGSAYIASRHTPPPSTALGARHPGPALSAADHACLNRRCREARGPRRCPGGSGDGSRRRCLGTAKAQPVECLPGGRPGRTASLDRSVGLPDAWMRAVDRYRRSWSGGGRHVHRGRHAQGHRGRLPCGSGRPSAGCAHLPQHTHRPSSDAGLGEAGWTGRALRCRGLRQPRRRSCPVPRCQWRTGRGGALPTDRPGAPTAASGWQVRSPPTHSPSPA